MTLEEINVCCVRYRGIVLNYMTKIERMMDIYLCKYFSNEEHKQDELLNFVFGTLRMTFENKRGIFVYLTKHKYINLCDDYPTLLNELQELFSKRTIFAHYIVDTSNYALSLPSGTIRFTKFMNEVTYDTFSENDMKLLEGNMIQIYFHLVDKASKGMTA